MFHKSPQSILGVILLFFINSSNATTVTYDVTNIAGNTWEYTYTVNNDTLSVDIEEFTIWFDVDLYENLAVGTTPADWDPLVVEPDPAVPPNGDDGFYDALALVSGIAPDGSLGGFSVQFDYLGSGSPGNQFFEIINPNSFATIDDGYTQIALVPIPAAFWLFASGFAGLFLPSAFRKTYSKL
jgi:hypothetical protein